MLSSRISSPYLCDESRHLKGVALAELDGFFLGEKLISDDSKTYIIAEIGNNHRGSVVTAKLLVDAAVDAGACCAKFQMRTMEELYTKRSGDDLAVEYTKSILNKFQLSNSELLSCLTIATAEV